MAYDLASRGTGGKDWSCGIGDDPSPQPAAFVAGAAVIGLCIAGVFAASSMGGTRHTKTMIIDRPRKVRKPSGPPTMIMVPGRHGFEVNPQASRYFTR
jgi:hypothetical protein